MPGRRLGRHALASPLRLHDSLSGQLLGQSGGSGSCQLRDDRVRRSGRLGTTTRSLFIKSRRQGDRQVLDGPGHQMLQIIHPDDKVGQVQGASLLSVCQVPCFGESLGGETALDKDSLSLCSTQQAVFGSGSDEKSSELSLVLGVDRRWLVACRLSRDRLGCGRRLPLEDGVWASYQCRIITSATKDHVAVHLQSSPLLASSSVMLSPFCAQPMSRQARYHPSFVRYPLLALSTMLQIVPRVA